MKTLTKLAMAVPAFALLTACATSPTAPVVTPKPAEQLTQLAYDRMAPARYTCGDAGEILAKESVNKQQVMLNVTLPALKFNQQSVLLNEKPAASGVRYVNDANPASTLTWHTKGKEALFAVDWANGDEYKAVCKML
jgi:membrane-bound inhibitor of C-type lysozyme